MIPVIIINM